MIGSVQELDILEELKRGHHVFIDVPFEGGQAALDYQASNDEGYGLLCHLQEDHPTLEVGHIPAHKEFVPSDIAGMAPLLGDRYTWLDEAEGVTWHFVYTHSTQYGHLPMHFWDYIEIVVPKLDEWWQETEEGIPMHGVHSVRWGTGVHHARVGDYRANPNVMLAVMANTEIEFNLRHD